MDGKYASLTRVWKSNHIGKVLEVLDESEGIEYVASRREELVALVVLTNTGCERRPIVGKLFAGIPERREFFCRRSH